MTQAGKMLKITSLAALFIGLGALVFGVVIAVKNVMDMDAWATTFEGLASTVYGVRTAILANVPSNTEKIRTKAVILFLCALVIGGYFLYVRQGIEIAQLCFAGAICVVAFGAIVIAHRIVREQLRA